ncbi:MAG: hypothetical protein BIFFINMI_01503 [Phycisphaerae bacterium]|nr:hypothetical protein [Phycisphaerae bacterium]
MTDAYDATRKARNRRIFVQAFLVLLVLLVLVALLRPGLVANRAIHFTGESPHAKAPMMADADRSLSQGSGQPGLFDLPAASAAPIPDIAQKIIYNAAMSTSVKDADAFRTGLTGRIVALGGYVSQMSADTRAGRQPSGQIVAKVPAEKLAELRDAVRSMATVLSDELTSENVTDQYVDLEARLTSKQAEEARLTELMKTVSAKLEDLLKVEEQLTRVRGEIEQLQGRKRVWDHQVRYSTLSVSYTVAEVYQAQPLAPAEETFGQEVSRTLRESWSSLVSTGRAVAIAGVAFAPWLPLALVLILLAWWLIRRVTRTK